MIAFVLRVFRTHDEEVLQTHLPLVFAGLTELVRVSRYSTP